MSVNITTIGLVNVVMLKKSKLERTEIMQNSNNNGDKSFVVFKTITRLLCKTIIKQHAIEKRNATFKKRPPDGNKLTIFATARNNNEKPNNFFICLVKSAFKNITEKNISVK
jgi:hypothetical protein